MYAAIEPSFGCMWDFLYIEGLRAVSKI